MHEVKLKPTVTVTITKDDHHILGYVEAASVQDAMTHPVHLHYHLIKWKRHGA